MLSSGYSSKQKYYCSECAYNNALHEHIIAGLVAENRRFWFPYLHLLWFQFRVFRKIPFLSRDPVCRLLYSARMEGMVDYRRQSMFACATFWSREKIWAQFLLVSGKEFSCAPETSIFCWDLLKNGEARPRIVANELSPIFRARHGSEPRPTYIYFLPKQKLLSKYQRCCTYDEVWFSKAVLECFYIAVKWYWPKFRTGSSSRVWAYALHK